MSDVGSARRVKDQLKTELAAESWCAGVGVVREDGIGFIVRVTVRSSGLAEAKNRVPARIGDTVIQLVETDD